MEAESKRRAQALIDGRASKRAREAAGDEQVAATGQQGSENTEDV